MTAVPTVSAVVLAHGQEPTLERCITALLSSEDVDLEIIVVDNMFDDAVRERVRVIDRVNLVGPPLNRGFAGGCNVGVAQSMGEFVVLINSDAFVERRAIAELVSVAGRAQVGVASASVRLDDQPDVLNSAGNPVHFTGLSWSGAFGERAANHDEERAVPSASGAAMALRRETWDELAGFDEAFFAYLEDADLSLRTWQAGLEVRYVPRAVVRHSYEFSRNATKLYLLERNRLLMLLTLYSRRSLLVLFPALLLFELAMFAQACVSGWGRQKIRGWLWLVRNASHVRHSRARVRSRRVVPDNAWMRHLCGEMRPTNVETPPGFGLFSIALGWYWRAARSVI